MKKYYGVSHEKVLHPKNNRKKFLSTYVNTI